VTHVSQATFGVLKWIIWVSPLHTLAGDPFYPINFGGENGFTQFILPNSNWVKQAKELGKREPFG